MRALDSADAVHLDKSKPLYKRLKILAFSGSGGSLGQGMTVQEHAPGEGVVEPGHRRFSVSPKEMRGVSSITF